MFHPWSKIRIEKYISASSTCPICAWRRQFVAATHQRHLLHRPSLPRPLLVWRPLDDQKQTFRPGWFRHMVMVSNYIPPKNEMVDAKNEPFFFFGWVFHISFWLPKWSPKDLVAFDGKTPRFRVVDFSEKSPEVELMEGSNGPIWERCPYWQMTIP